MKEVTIGIEAPLEMVWSNRRCCQDSVQVGFISHAYNSYQSVIRGGHIWLRVRGKKSLFTWRSF
jgi:hypothetical protein